MAKTCASCKKASETGDGYKPLSSFSPDEYCPACLDKKQKRIGLPILLALFLIVMVVTWISGRRKPGESSAWLLLNFSFLAVAQLLTILPHELGHALAARLTGMKVHSVVVGSGAVLFKGRFLGGTLQIHALPDNGATTVTDPREKGYKGRMFLMVAGGPLVNLLMLGAAFPFIGLKQCWHLVHSSSQPLLAFALANILVLVSNLIPRKVTMSGAKLDSDGRWLCKIPFLSPAEVRKQAAAHYVMEGLDCILKKKYDESIRWSRDGLQRHPESMLLRNNLGMALFGKDDIAGGLEEFRAVAASADVEPSIRALAQSNVAVAVILLERVDLLPESDQGTAEALKTLPDQPFIRSSRGAVLVELGKLDEGIPLLREGMTAERSPDQKAIVCCALAMALRKKGDPAAGTLLLQQAETLDPKCLLLSRARRAFGLA